MNQLEFNEIKIVGTMAVTGFPLWKMCLEELQKCVDELYVRFDATVGTKEAFSQLTVESFPKLKRVLVVGKKVWNRYNWREQMLRMLDEVRPDMVLNLDEDEVFESENIEEDLKLFWNSEFKQLSFDYCNPMPGMAPKLYPDHEHIKAFKWQPKLTFIPYKGSARLSNIKSVTKCPRTKILHYCWFDKECIEYRNKRRKRKHKAIRKYGQP